MGATGACCGHPLFQKRSRFANGIYWEAVFFFFFFLEDPSQRGATEFIIKPCPLAARTSYTFRPTSFSSVQLFLETRFKEGCGGATSKAVSPGCRQRRTFSSTTFSSVWCPNGTIINCEKDMEKRDGDEISTRQNVARRRKGQLRSTETHVAGWADGFPPFGSSSGKGV